MGFGGGVAIEVVPPSIERIDVVELEPEVIAANRLVAKGRWRDPLADPRVHVASERRAQRALARGVALRRDRLAAFASLGGRRVPSLYARVLRARAQPARADGAFVQWIGLTFVDEALLRSMLATLRDVFPHVRVYSPPPYGSILFLSSAEPFDMDESVPRALAASPGPFGELGIHVPEDVTASLLLDEAAVAELARGAPLNRDGHNRLASRSNRLGNAALIKTIDDLIAPVDPLVRALPKSADPFYLVRQLSGARAARVAKALPDPVDRAVAEAIAGIEDGKRAGPRRQLEDALRVDPRNLEARAAMLRLSAGAIAGGADPEQILAPPLSGEERALVDGWTTRARDPRALATGELDARLAAVPPRHPLASDAMRLRVQARLASGDPVLVKDAGLLATEHLGLRSDPSSILLLAETAAASGDPATVLETLSELLDALDPRRPSSRAFVYRAHELARATPADDPELSWYRAAMLRRLGVGVPRGAPRNAGAGGR